MPGIFGFVRDLDFESATALLAGMARALEPEESEPPQLLHEHQVGLGRVTLGIINPRPQPVWNADRSICLVMEGELYGSEDLRRELSGRGRLLADEDDPELILHLYVEQGLRFPSRLNGAFVAAIWDLRQQRLVIANDHLGLHPLYYAQHAGGLLFASGVRALLAEGGLLRRIDKTAIAELLTFDHVLGQRTLLESIALMPQGSVLEYHDQRLQLHRYWTPKSPEAYPVRPESEYGDELLHLLRQAVRRQKPAGGPGELLLSGGLDSRALLGVMEEQTDAGAVRTFTWGIPGSDEVRYARDAARVAKTDHRFYELKADWLPRLGRKAVRATDGMGNIVNLHAMAVLEDPRRAAVLYKGFLGDAMFGFGMRPRYWADYASADEVEVHLQAYRDYNVLSFDFPEHARLFTGSFRSEVGEGVLDDYRAAMRASGSRQLSDQRLYIDFTQRVPRMTLCGVEAVRLGAVVRMPFADKDLVEFSLRVPPGLRLGRQVMVQAFIRAFPALSQIPFSPSGLPLVACARDVRIRAERWAHWHLQKLGLGWVVGVSRPSKAYDRWFRTGLRPWVSEVLLSDASLSRGYYEPDYVRRLLEEHWGGANHAVRIGALLSLELWHQQFIDQDQPLPESMQTGGQLVSERAMVA